MFTLALEGIDVVEISHNLSAGDNNLIACTGRFRIESFTILGNHGPGARQEAPVRCLSTFKSPA